MPRGRAGESTCRQGVRGAHCWTLRSLRSRPARVCAVTALSACEQERGREHMPRRRADERANEQASVRARASWSNSLADVEPLNLDAVETDLADVEKALARLDDGSYWTDENTQLPIDPAHLAIHPTARTNPSPLS